MIDYRLRHALDTIELTYGDVCDIKAKSLLKFGSNELIGTSYATIETQPVGILNETFLTDNLIINVSSDNAGDTQNIVIEGHKLVGGNFIFVSQTATLNGLSKVVLTTPLARCVRIYNVGTVNFAGQLYVYENDTITAGVPDTDTKVHCMLTEDNTSTKASTTISNTDYYIITQMMGSVNKKTSAQVDIEVQVRQKGSVFLTGAISSLNSTGVNTVVVNMDPAIIVPRNADVRLRAKASTTNVSVSGWINGYLAKVKG